MEYWKIICVFGVMLSVTHCFLGEILDAPRWLILWVVWERWWGGMSNLTHLYSEWQFACLSGNVCEMIKLVLHKCILKICLIYSQCGSTNINLAFSICVCIFMVDCTYWKSLWVICNVMSFFADSSLLKTIDGAHFEYVLKNHQALVSVMHLLPENVLISGNENIPGLATSPTGKPLLFVIFQIKQSLNIGLFSPNISHQIWSRSRTFI